MPSSKHTLEELLVVSSRLLKTSIVYTMLEYCQSRILIRPGIIVLAFHFDSVSLDALLDFRN